MKVADSMWVSLTNWLTPTVLFCILNLMIGSIFISSSLKTRKKDDNHEHGSEAKPMPQIVRAPSLIERVKSINFSFRRSDQHYPFQSVAPQYVDSDEDQENKADEDQEHKAEEAQEVHSETHHIMRSQSEEVRTKVAPRKMKRSASEKVLASYKEKEEEEEAEVVNQNRPATVRERKATTHEGDEAVDEKADDFINRFRQQLKLQRLDSILRYKEMMNRGLGR